MQDVFAALTMLTLGAALLVWLLQRLKLSPILGYLALGIAVSPFQRYFFDGPEAVNLLAEFAAVFLMFFIGLEFHLGEVGSMLRLCFGAGTLQVLLASAGAGVAAWLAGAGVLVAAVVGVMLAFSSTALVMKAFEDRREADSLRARTALAVLLMQDLAAIVVVAVLPLASKNAVAMGLAPRLGLLLVVLPILFLGSRYLLPKLFERAASARNPESFSLLSLGVCLSVALAAQWAGASLALGAFLGGLVLCQTPFASQIVADLSTLRNLALAFFFVTVGMLVNLHFVAAHAGLLLAALLGLLLLKLLTTALALYAFKVPLAVAAAVALALAQIGEFSFVLAQQTQSSGLLPPEWFSFVLALAVLSMLLAPLQVGCSGTLNRWWNRVWPPSPGALPLEGAAAERTPRAIVVGYGPVGRTLTRILRDFGIRPIIIDMNINTVKKLTAAGETALFGDAGRREILQAAQVESATYMLVTLPDLPGRIPVVATARMLNPKLKIFTRARYLGERAMMEEAGATAVSYEEAEVAVSLAEFFLRDVGAEEAQIAREQRRIRDEIAVRTGLTLAK